MVISLFVLGWTFKLLQFSGSLGWIAVISLMIYVGSFSVGLRTVFWLVLSEIYSLRVRGKTMDLNTLANWAATLPAALTQGLISNGASASEANTIAKVPILIYNSGSWY